MNALSEHQYNDCKKKRISETNIFVSATNPSQPRKADAVQALPHTAITPPLGAGGRLKDIVTRKVDNLWLL